MSKLIGIISFICLLVNMSFWTSLLLVTALIRLFVPLKSWKKLCTLLTISIGETCIDFNTLWIKLLHKPKLEIEGLEGVDYSTWYVATSNHQSWADIFILQAVTNKKVPLLRFFMKDVLKWVPIIWIVGWSLDMPFLKRYSEQRIKKNPELRGKDTKKMKQAFKRLSTNPGTIFSFSEGTRFTKEKHKNQNSSFKSLLLPKAGGIGITLSTMPYISFLLDFTISYESESRSFWSFLCGKMSSVKIKVRIIDIPHSLLNRDYSTDKPYRNELKEWLYEIWKEKNKFLN